MQALAASETCRFCVDPSRAGYTDPRMALRLSAQTPHTRQERVYHKPKPSIYVVYSFDMLRFRRFLPRSNITKTGKRILDAYSLGYSPGPTVAVEP
jgi:hypothetical protein